MIMPKKNKEDLQIQPAIPDHMEVMRNMDNLVTNLEIDRQNEFEQNSYASQIVKSMDFNSKLNLVKDNINELRVALYDRDNAVESASQVLFLI
jgi:hypothetical protein